MVTHRLPVDGDDQGEQLFHWGTVPGSLLGALVPFMQRAESAWVGWDGSTTGRSEPFVAHDLQLLPVALTDEDLAAYHHGFCSRTLWPLFHDAVAHPEFRRSWWDAYVRTNLAFAKRTAATAAAGATVWVHDYHLMLVPTMLRRLRPDVRIGFFLHIPFPPVELLQQLPWHRQLLQGLLGADLFGVQLQRSAQNFLEAVCSLLNHPVSADGVDLSGGRKVRIRAYPVSVDAQALNGLAAGPATSVEASLIRQRLGDPRSMLLSVDQLDCTAGICQRLTAFGELLQEGRLAPDQVALVQIATTSHEHIERDSDLRDDIDRLVGRINGDAARVDHPPITYVHSTDPSTSMAAMYRAADVLVATPLRDGMNLTAKEYVACRQADDGALVLSELSGASPQLVGAYGVNPYDIDGLKDSIVEAVTDSHHEREARMHLLREEVFGHDIHDWVEHFLHDLRTHPRPTHPVAYCRD